MLKKLIYGLLAGVFMILGVNTQNVNATGQQVSFDTVTNVNFFADVWGVQFRVDDPILNTSQFTFYIPTSNFHVLSRSGVESNVVFLDSNNVMLDEVIFTDFLGGFFIVDLLNDVNIDIKDVSSIVVTMVQSYTTPPAGYLSFLQTNSFYSFIIPNNVRFFFNQQLVKTATFIDFLPTPPNIVVPQGSNVTWLDSNGNIVNFDLIINKDIDLFGVVDAEIITWTFIVNGNVYDVRQFAFGQFTTEANLPDDPQIAGQFFWYWQLETRLGNFRFNTVDREVLQSVTLVARFEAQAMPTLGGAPIVDAPAEQPTGLEALFINIGLFDDAGLSFVFMIVLIIMNVSFIYFKLGTSFIVLADLAVMGLFAILGLVPIWGVFIFSIIGVIALILLNGRGVNYE